MCRSTIHDDARTHIFYILNSNYRFRVCFLPRSAIVLGHGGTKRRGSRRWLCHSVDRSTLGSADDDGSLSMREIQRWFNRKTCLEYTPDADDEYLVFRNVTNGVWLFPGDIAIWSLEGGATIRRVLQIPGPSIRNYPLLTMTVRFYSDNFF